MNTFIDLDKLLYNILIFMEISDMHYKIINDGNYFQL